MKSYFGAWKIVFFCRPQRMYFLRKTLRENIEFHAFYGHFILAPRCNTTIVKNVFRNVKKKSRENPGCTSGNCSNKMFCRKSLLCHVQKRKKSYEKISQSIKIFFFTQSTNIISFFQNIVCKHRISRHTPAYFLQNFQTFQKSIFWEVDISMSQNRFPAFCPLYSPPRCFSLLDTCVLQKS